LILDTGTYRANQEWARFQPPSPTRYTDFPSDAQQARIAVEIGGIPIEGRPLAEVSLEGAMILHADGQREPFKGFVAREGQSVTAAIRAALPEGATLIDGGEPVELRAVQLKSWWSSLAPEARAGFVERRAQKVRAAMMRKTSGVRAMPPEGA